MSFSPSSPPLTFTPSIFLDDAITDHQQILEETDNFDDFLCWEEEEEKEEYRPVYDVITYQHVHPFDFVVDSDTGRLPINTYYIYVPWRVTLEDQMASTFGCQGCGSIAYKKRGTIGVCHNCDVELYCVYCTGILEVNDFHHEAFSTLLQYDYVRTKGRFTPCHRCKYNGYC